MSHVFVNIGSNLGNRRLNLSRAARALESEFGWFELSHVVESKPQGFDSPNDFLNLGMHFISDLEPEEILRRILKIEHDLSPESHRNADGSYADRLVDIDLIAIDDVTVESETLTLPHPRMAERRFVLEPMQELAAGWRHPATGLTPAEMLAELRVES